MLLPQPIVLETNNILQHGHCSLTASNTVLMSFDSRLGMRRCVFVDRVWCWILRVDVELSTTGLLLYATQNCSHRESTKSYMI
jgi:hypothetical protein